MPHNINDYLLPEMTSEPAPGYGMPVESFNIQIRAYNKRFTSTYNLFNQENANILLKRTSIICTNDKFVKLYANRDTVWFTLHKAKIANNIDSQLGMLNIIAKEENRPIQKNTIHDIIEKITEIRGSLVLETSPVPDIKAPSSKPVSSSNKKMYGDEVKEGGCCRCTIQ